MTARHDEEHRRAQLVTALATVRGRISAACTPVHRDPRSITLVAVTKSYPVEDVARLVQLGVLDVGESRDQEAVAKAGAIAGLLAGSGPPRWHFVGRLQSRKCASVASYASAVHSVDRLKLVARLADGVAQSGRFALDVFVQVSLDDDPERGGSPVEAVLDLAGAVNERAELTLRGVMAVPPLGSSPDDAYARLAEVSASVRQRYPDASAISAGMSEDLDAAIRHGSTHVRVGTALLGRREPFFR